VTLSRRTLTGDAAADRDIRRYAYNLDGIFASRQQDPILVGCEPNESLIAVVNSAAVIAKRNTRSGIRDAT
jgi:hypothetical protein